VGRPAAGDRYGDVFVDTNRAHEVYRQWLAMARPRRPRRAPSAPVLPGRFKPDASTYRLEP